MNRRAVATTAVVATVATLASLLSATPAMAAPAAFVPSAVPASAGLLASAPRIPVVDSEIGIGKALAAGAATPIALGLGAGVASALVRLSLFAPAADVTLDASGSPALHVKANTSSSTTVLLPVVDGAVVLTASAATDLRVEVLTSFASSTAPGAMTALAAPVTRADTANGIAADAVTTTPVLIGLTGQGGVPAEQVRAAFVTVSTTVDAPTDLLMAGQRIAVPVGTSAVTTLVALTADGEVDAALASGSGALRIDVRGYVADSAQGSAAVAVDGSYVPADGITPQSETVRDSRATAVDLASFADARFSVVLVESGAADATTLLNVGTEIQGRAQGAVVDATIGAQAQLALVPADAVTEIRRGSAEVVLQRLGDIVGDDASASSDLAVSIESPRNGAEVSLDEVASFVLDGTVESASASLESVRIYATDETAETADDTLIGTAELQYRAGVSRWSFDLGVPATGSYTFRAEAVDRTGLTSSSEVTLTVTLPDETVPLMNADTRVVTPAQLESLVALTDSTVVFGVDPGYAPGDVIAGAASTVSPQGFLRRVQSVEKTDAGWVVTTVTASLIEAISQADVTEEVNLMRDAAPTVTPLAPDAPDLVIDDGGVENITVFHNASARRSAQSDPEVDLETELQDGITVSTAFTWEPDGTETDASTQTPAAIGQTKRDLEVSGGAMLEATSTAGFALKFVLKIDLVWDYFNSTVEVVEFSTILTRSTEVKLSASVSLEAEMSIKRKLAEVDFAPITIVVPTPIPFPIIITSGIEIGIAGVVTAEASLGVEWSAKVVQDYGFKYVSGRFVNATTEPKVTNTPPQLTPGLSGKVTAAVGPTAELSVSIYDAAGPTIEGAGVVGLEFEVAPEEIKFEAYLEGTVSIGVELKVPIIDRVILKETVAASAALRWTLLTWSSTPEEVEEDSDPTPGEGDDGGVTDPNMPRPNPAPEFADSDLRVTLYWNNKSDMDLHVLEPSGERIWYGDTGPTATSGQLDIDSNSNCRVERPNEPGGIENVYWPNGVTAPVGEYTITTARYNACGLPNATWVIEIWSGDELVLKQTGQTEKSFTITVNDSSQARSATPVEHITVTDADVPVDVTVGSKE